MAKLFSSKSLLFIFALKLNVAPKSIRMARYRIKQKLKLDENDKLDSFISDLGITSEVNP